MAYISNFFLTACLAPFSKPYIISSRSSDLLSRTDSLYTFVLKFNTYFEKVVPEITVRIRKIENAFIKLRNNFRSEWTKELKNYLRKNIQVAPSLCLFKFPTG